MSTQTELDEIMRKIAEDHAKLNAKQQEFAIKEIGRIRSEIAELLADYEDGTGTIKRQRLTRLLRDLETIETNVRKYGMATLENIVDETATFTTTAVNGALNEVLGAAVSGVVIDRVNADVLKYVINRFGDDGLVLSDRVWNLAGDMRDELSKTLRAGIIRGESVSALTKRVRRVHDNETWKIRRLVVTEGNTAYRTATAMNASRSDVVKAVRVHRGEANRPEHRCSQLERTDRYGMGAGIFKPSDPEIYNMHVNCTGYLTYELDEDYL